MNKYRITNVKDYSYLECEADKVELKPEGIVFYANKDIIAIFPIGYMVEKV